MKSKLFFLVFLFGIFVQCAFSQIYKGIYVDGFDKILGNKIKEDSLLNYCRKNGFNALTTYKTKDIEKKIKITEPASGGKILASLLKGPNRIMV